MYEKILQFICVQQSVFSSVVEYVWKVYVLENANANTKRPKYDNFK